MCLLQGPEKYLAQIEHGANYLHANQLLFTASSHSAIDPFLQFGNKGGFLQIFRMK